MQPSKLSLLLLLAACTSTPEDGGTDSDTDTLSVPDTTVASSFDTDAEGWIISDFVAKSDYTFPGPTYDPIWSADDGTPGGNIQFLDLEHLSFFFNAPERFHGDMSRFVGGTLTWWASTQYDGEPWSEDSFVVIGGPAGFLYHPIDALDGMGTWTEHSLTLAPGGDWRVGAPEGDAPDLETFTAILSEVETWMLPGESAGDLVETTRLDEVVLTAP